MPKKVLLLAVIFMLLFSTTASANDITFLKSEDIYCTITPKTNKIALGEDFEFTIELTNRSTEDCYFININQLFTGDNGYDITYEHSDSMICIPKYKTIKIDCTYTIPFNIDWYQKYGKYYIDVNADIVYCNKSDTWYRNELEKQEYCAEYGCSEYEQYYFIANNAKRVTLEITNLNDGTNIAEITADYADSITYIRSDILKEAINSNLFPITTSTASIKNISDKECTLLAYNNNKVYNEDTSILEVGETFEFDENGIAPFLSCKYLPDTATEKNTAIVEYDGEYYGIYSSEILPIEVISHKCLDFSKQIIENESDVDSGYVDVNIEFTNISDVPLDNFFFIYPAVFSYVTGFRERETDIDFGPTLMPDEKISKVYEDMTTEEIKDSDYNFYVEINKHEYVFHVYKNLNTNKTECVLIHIFKLVEKEDTPTATLSSIPSADSNIISTTFALTPTVQATPETSEANNLNSNSKDEINITNVDEKDVLPKWVWSVLLIASAISIFLIVIFHKPKSDNKADNEQ